MFEPYFTYQTETHYDDLDGQMILHHPQYFIYVERAQQAWIEHVLQAPRFDWRNYPDMYLVVRHLEIDYMRSINGVMPFKVVLHCLEVRAAVWTVGFEFRSPDGSVLYAKGKRSNCKVDRETHQPAMWTDVFIDRFSSLKLARPN
jgi:acyl-CoA thioester hydrolase